MQAAKLFLLMGVLGFLASCATYTTATHDFAKSVGTEWADYKQDATSSLLIHSIISDERITLDEAQVFYETVVPEYNVFIGNDTSMTDFDLRIRQRYVKDYTTLLYGE